MNSKDPVSTQASDDITIVRHSAAARPEEFKSATAQKQNKSSHISLLKLGQLNPLEKVASGLLALLTRINVTHSHANPDNLKQQVTKEIYLFHKYAQANSIDPETRNISSYVLCTVLDEAVLNTPWGNNSDWVNTSLLSFFHKEMYGGERFFEILTTLGKNPSKNLHLLELMYLCLALGFEGSYRIVDGGKEKLNRDRKWLYQLICKQRGQTETEISSHWESNTGIVDRYFRNVPLWVMAATALALMAVIFSYLLFDLNTVSDPVFKQLYAIKSDTEENFIEPDVLDYPIPKVTLYSLLAPEIRQGRLKVDVKTKQERIIIQSDSLFDFGSTEIKAAFIPVLRRMATSLNTLSGHISIVGHTDDRPIRNTQFPSNWHLSKARAKKVSDFLAKYINRTSRLSVSGKADLEPIASNNSSQGRAENRRVEIILVKQL